MNIFGGLAGLGSVVATLQVEWRTRDGGKPQTVTLRGRNGETEVLPLFTNKDSIVGDVKATPIPGKKADHQGIRVQLIGQIEQAAERGNPSDFLSLSRDLAVVGDLTQQATLPFEFNSVEMEHDSYKGLQVRLKYLLRVTMQRPYGASIVRDFPFWVRNYKAIDTAPPTAAVKMEVGIEDCLHIEFEYPKNCFHLNDIVVGKIYFLLVRIRLKHMELEIRRRETIGSGKAAKTEVEPLAKFEIMDGAPVRGEVIPIRMYLAPYDMTPTYRGVHNKFSVRYSLNLVLVDQEDRRYFKQQEIELFRAPPQPPGIRGKGMPLLSRGVTGTPSADAEAEAVGADSLKQSSSASAQHPAEAMEPHRNSTAAQPSSTGSAGSSKAADEAKTAPPLQPVASEEATAQATTLEHEVPSAVGEATTSVDLDEQPVLGTTSADVSAVGGGGSTKTEDDNTGVHS